jgi:hypothetical protein
MGLLKQLMIFGKPGLQGLPTRSLWPTRGYWGPNGRHGKVPYLSETKADDCFNSPEASAHVQVQRKYGWEPSNQVCGTRGAAAHACAPGLSTGRRLMPMRPIRCRRTVLRSSDGSTVAAHEESTAASAAGKRLSVWNAQRSCNCIDHQTFACLCMRGH